MDIFDLIAFVIGLPFFVVGIRGVLKGKGWLFYVSFVVGGYMVVPLVREFVLVYTSKSIVLATTILLFISLFLYARCAYAEKEKVWAKTISVKYTSFFFALTIILIILWVVAFSFLD